MKQPAIGRNLIRVNCYRGASGKREWRLTLTVTDGPAQMRGRELHVFLTGADVAKITGAIPALSIKDDDDVAAISRVLRLLNKEYIF